MSAPASPTRAAAGGDNAPSGPPPLLAELLRHAPRFNFFRFCQLLDAMRPDGPRLGAADTPAHDPVRFRPHPALGFPAAEFVGVEVDTGSPAAPPTVRTTFMGLYGVDARMPWHVVEAIAGRGEGHEALAAFLDLFNHRLAVLLYRCWHKYRYPVGFEAGARDRVSRALLCLVGLGNREAGERDGLPAAGFLTMLGLGGQRTRTAEGLAAIVRHVSPCARVVVQARHPVVHFLAPARLGDAAVVLRPGALVLGRRLTERNSTVRILIEPASDAGVDAMLPGGEDHADLMTLLRIYLGYRFDAELVLRLDPARLPATVLGRCPARLGLTAMAGRPPDARPLEVRLGRYRGLPSPREPAVARPAPSRMTNRISTP
ncbi:MAG: type VI secretion system baseplate subunit TssG [Candidatus Dactylopiibacterium sp.]|nr:type VI secretion system baseplate subunit TssG [Candidatus Dactylopiibacterium sp.]